MLLRSLPLIVFTLLACSPISNRTQQTQATTRSAEAAFTWHDKKRSVDKAIEDALLAPEGSDYPAALAAVRASDRPAAVKDFEAGNLIVSAADNPRAVKRPVETVEQGIALLEKAALATGEGAANAPGALRTIFTDGVGPPTAQRSLQTFLSRRAGLRCLKRARLRRIASICDANGQNSNFLSGTPSACRRRSG